MRRNSAGRCVSCGNPIEFGRNGHPDHHCSKSHEAAKRGADTRGQEPTVYANRSFSQRLSDGFGILSGAY